MKDRLVFGGTFTIVLIIMALLFSAFDREAKRADKMIEAQFAQLAKSRYEVNHAKALIKLLDDRVSFAAASAELTNIPLCVKEAAMKELEAERKGKR